MTVDTFKTFEFVLDKADIALLNSFVAAGAVHRSVLAFELEGRFVMVELLDRPLLKSMAPGAVGYAEFFKLFLVRILMAIGTGGRQTGKLSVFKFRGRLVAFPTGLLLMGPLQFECGFTVIEFIVLPTAGSVTLLTCFIRVPFFGDLTGMHIFVTIHTALPDLSEHPFFFLSVAGETRRGHVSAFQREFCPGMVFNRKSALPKTIHRMAYDAIGDHAIIGKLGFVVVGMAACAMVVRQWIGHAFRMVAFFAIHRNVLASECKTGLVVVKFAQIGHFFK